MADAHGSGVPPTPQPSLSSQVCRPLVLLVLGFLLVALVLLLPADKVAPRLSAVAPYALVFFIGGIVGLAEMASTFPNYPREALRTRWGLLLMLVNALAATLALWIVHTYTPDANLPLLVLGVGIGFQALIRTRFTIAKSIGESGSNVELNLGWLYDQFQHLCKTQIDLDLMRARRTAVKSRFWHSNASSWDHFSKY